MQNAAAVENSQIRVSNSKLELNLLWKILPIFVWLAASFPKASHAINDLSNNGIITDKTYSGPWLKSNLLNYLGEFGPQLFAPIAGALIAFAVFRLAKSINSSDLIAAIASITSICVPVFGISPSLEESPDDAMFAGFVLLSFASLIKANKDFNPSALAFALIFSAIACWFRPFAAWPMLAVFVTMIALNRNYAGRPYYGLISALCWGPGLFAAYKVSEFLKTDFMGAQMPNAQTIIDQNSELQILPWVLNATPILIFAIFGIFGIAALFVQKQNRKIAIAICIFIASAVIGAFFYGSVIGARFLLDNIFLTLGIVAISAFVVSNLSKQKIVQNNSN